jgi:hypothetical protein
MRNLILLIFFISHLLAFGQVKVVVKIQSIEGYEGYEKFAIDAGSKLETVLNSDKFKAEVLKANFTETNGLSNQQIYEKIMNAHELLGEGGEDGVIDLRLRTISKEKDGRRWMRNCRIGSFAKTIGIDGNGDGINAICPTWLQHWFETNNVAELAGHYAHEYMHVLGFSHPGRQKSRTAVYQVGEIVSRLISSQ